MQVIHTDGSMTQKNKVVEMDHPSLNDFLPLGYINFLRDRIYMIFEWAEPVITIGQANSLDRPAKVNTSLANWEWPTRPGFEWCSSFFAFGPRS